jgi:hypothetical protein
VARSRNEVWRVKSRVDLFQAGEGLLGAKSKVETRQKACECPVMGGG